MRATLFCVTVLVCVQASAAAPKTEAASDDADVTRRVHELLTAYAHKDEKALLQLTDGSAAVFGKDIAESCHEKACVESWLKSELQLFDTASFGDPKNLSIETTKELASVLFDVAFEAKTGSHTRKTTLRLATTWRKKGASWLLVQWLMTEPTTGQSAKDVLQQTLK